MSEIEKGNSQIPNKNKIQQEECIILHLILL